MSRSPCSSGQFDEGHLSKRRSNADNPDDDKRDCEVNEMSDCKDGDAEISGAGVEVFTNVKGGPCGGTSCGGVGTPRPPSSSSTSNGHTESEKEDVSVSFSRQSLSHS